MANVPPGAAGFCFVNAVCPPPMFESESYVKPPMPLLVVAGRALAPGREWVDGRPPGVNGLMAGFCLFVNAVCPASGAMAESESYVKLPLRG